MSGSLEGRIDIRLHRRAGRVERAEILSSRPQLAQRLMAGRTPDEAADLAGLIFSLCGQAQSCAARAAGLAAQGVQTQERLPHGDPVPRVLMELAQEHAWRLLINWPEQAGRSPDMDSLLRLRQSAGDPARFAAGLAQLLETVLLGEPAAVWLARDFTGFRDWLGLGNTVVARLFADLGDGPDQGVSNQPFLPPLAGLDAGLAQEIARQALADPAFCAAPRLRGQPAETGALARVADHPLVAAWLQARGRGAGARLLARLVELAGLPERLADPAGWPVVAGWPLEDNGGVAAVETARGLLLHALRLEAGRVAEYRIIAPTEWNFHPVGPLAQALESLPASPDLDVRARLVAQSLDPCVAYSVEMMNA
ncbi:MAG: nickel-dependent hydrogenase large subunit [Pseudomonadota bacterium]